MPPRRPQLSITLPRNFTFHYTDGQGPRTPEPNEPRELGQPSSPRPDRVQLREPASMITNRRLRPALSGARTHDVPIPSIEQPEHSTTQPDRSGSSNPDANPSLLAPQRPHLRFVTPVRTPGPTSTSAATEPFARRGEWSRPDEAGESDGSMSRPTSACSIFSDSSASSSETSGSYPSAGDSPEDEFGYSTPTMTHPNKGKGRMAVLVDDRDVNHRPGARSSHKHRVQWTNEMDRHLWATYLLYLQDPTVTPFRCDPGRAPPLGVCHRVAREARRTWRGSRAPLATLAETPTASSSQVVTNRTALRNVHDEAHAVRTVSAPNFPRAGSAYGPSLQPPTPVEVSRSLPLIPWPRSDSATRRRLRELCQRRATNSSRLQRVLKSRSPTPATHHHHHTRPRMASPLGGFLDRAPFSTRDMSLSLATSTSSSMQPDGPLAQLAQEDGDGDGDGEAMQQDEDWFGQPLGGSSTGMTNFDSGLGGSNTTFGAGPTSSMRLGSPFDAGPPRMITSHRPSTISARSHSNTLGAGRASLRSPVRFTSTTLPLPGVIKRRAQRQMEEDLGAGNGADMRRNILEELMGSPVFGRGQRQARNRGFSLGDVSAAERLANVFRPPPSGGSSSTTPQQLGRERGVTMGDHHNMSDASGSSPYDGSEAPTPRAPSTQRRQFPPDRLGSPFRTATPVGHHQRTESVPVSSSFMSSDGPHETGMVYMFDQSPSVRTPRMG